MREAPFRLHLESAVVRGNGILKNTRFQSQHLVRSRQVSDRLNHLAAMAVTSHERHLPAKVFLVLQVGGGGSQVTHVEQEIRQYLALDTEIPLLDSRIARVRIDDAKSGIDHRIG